MPRLIASLGSGLDPDDRYHPNGGWVAPCLARLKPSLHVFLGMEGPNVVGELLLGRCLALAWQIIVRRPSSLIVVGISVHWMTWHACSSGCVLGSRYPQVGDIVYEECEQDTDAVWNEMPKSWMTDDQMVVVFMFW